MWRTIVCQMAHTATHVDFPPLDSAEPLPRDVERFREFLTHGSPGAHAYVVLLGLDTFDTSELLRVQKKGFRTARSSGCSATLRCRSTP